MDDWTDFFSKIKLGFTLYFLNEDENEENSFVFRGYVYDFDTKAKMVLLETNKDHQSYVMPLEEFRKRFYKVEYEG